MDTPKVYKTEAIVLRSLRLGEADKIITFFTPYLGKLRAVARGACRPKSKLGGHIEPLTHSLLMLARGQNLDIVTQGQTLHSFIPLRGDLWRTSCALYAAELVDRFMPDEAENRPVFQLLLDTLQRLCQVKPGSLALRYFELQILNHLGYPPQLQHCVNCDSPLEPIPNLFSSAAGGVLCPQCLRSQVSVLPLSVNALKLLRLMQSEPYSSVQVVRVNPELEQELERTMRGYLQYYLEREVKSAAWLDKLRRG